MVQGIRMFVYKYKGLSLNFYTLCKRGKWVGVKGKKEKEEM